jgi:hypothetical protein
VVKAALAARENPSRPIPRVLFIGDSITGSYWEKVQSNLDDLDIFLEHTADIHISVDADERDAP